MKAPQPKNNTGKVSGLPLWGAVLGLAVFLPPPSFAQIEGRHTNAAAVCLEYDRNTQLTEPQKLAARLLADLGEMLPVLPWILDDYHSSQPEICIDDRPISARGYLDVERNLIGLKSTLNYDEMLVILIHELQHLRQFESGYCPSNDVSMQANARAVFAIEADAMANTALIAWAFRQQGNDRLWGVMSNWEKYSDIAEKFEAEIISSSDLGKAAAAAFQQWYNSEWRKDSYYISSCSDYLDRLDASKLLPSYKTLPGDYLEQLCKLPDGQPYPCRVD